MSYLIIRSCLILFVTVSVSRADILTLLGGETLEVSIVESTDKSVHVVHPILGELHIAIDNIQSIKSPLSQAPENIASEEDLSKLPKDHSAWNQTIKLGAGYQTGQTNNVDLSTSYHAIKTVNEHEVVFDISYRFGGGVRKEFQSENDNVVPEGLLGIALHWNLQNNQTLVADTTWFPDFENFSNYLIVSIRHLGT